MARDLDLMEQELSNGYATYSDYVTLDFGTVVNIDTAYDENASVTTLSFRDEYTSQVVTGSSKRNIGEPKDKARGLHLAHARALRKLADKLESLHPETL